MSIVAASEQVSRCYHADPRDPDALGRSWWVLHARRTRLEKAIADRLLAADVPHLLPLQRVERVKPSRHRVTNDLPVFPAYLFLCGDEFDALNARRASRHILATIPVTPTDRANLVHDLSQLLDALESGAPLGKARPAPKSGDRARVISGPFEGYEGTFVRESGRDTFLLHVRMIGQVVPVQISSWDVEFIPTP